MHLGRTILALALVSLGLAFETARPGYVFEFPRDHFEHPAFAAEWWYYTGNLSASDGQPFGFELTFFRTGLGRAAKTHSTWDADQVYLAHFVVTDIESGRVHHHERLNRSGPGLAGSSMAEGLIWNGNWSVEFDLQHPQSPTQRLLAVADDASLDLMLEPAKPVVIHGKDGVSQKAAGEGRASHYASFTRLIASGRLTLDGLEFEVGGLAWMDHEFFSNNLSEDQAGWDWMSIQLDDGSDLMIYGLRNRDGVHGAFSGGTFVRADGTQLSLVADDLRLIPGRLWRSDGTGAEYPVEWTLEVPRIDLRLRVWPLLDAQEIVSSSALAPVYWEGAVRYEGEREGSTVEGKGYLEMTGYDKPVVLVRSQ